MMALEPQKNQLVGGVVQTKTADTSVPKEITSSELLLAHSPKSSSNQRLLTFLLDKSGKASD